MVCLLCISIATGLLANLAIVWRPYRTMLQPASCLVKGATLQSSAVHVPEGCSKKYGCYYYVMTPGWSVTVSLLSRYPLWDMPHTRPPTPLTSHYLQPWAASGVPTITQQGRVPAHGGIERGFCAGQVRTCLLDDCGAEPKPKAERRAGLQP